MASSPCGSIASLVACAKFEEFAEILRDGKSKGATWRNVLAYHTSKCCAPRHQHGFLSSLKDAGIDEVHQLLGQHFTTLDFGDKLFEGSPHGLPPFSCSSAVFATQLEAQEDACFFALAFLLCAVPGGVMLHKNSMKNVDAVREAAKAVRSAMLLQGPPVSGVFAQWSTWGESLGTQVLAPAVAPKEKIQHDASDDLLRVDVYTIFFRAALTGQIMGRLHVAAADPSGWSYASALRSADLNPFQYWIVKGTERLDPNHVLAEKLPLRFKREDFDEQGELHLDLVRADEQTTEMWTTALRQTTTRITSWADEDVDYGAASDDDDRGARSRSRPR